MEIMLYQNLYHGITTKKLHMDHSASIRWTLQLWPWITLLARCCHKKWIKGTCLRNGAKSRAIRYRSLVFPGDDGMHTCSWWRCVGHKSTSEPSNFPGFSSPMVESTMHGGWNSMAIGYGSQVPCNFAIGVLNLTKLKTESLETIRITLSLGEQLPWKIYILTIKKTRTRQKELFLLRLKEHQSITTIYGSWAQGAEETL